MEEGEGGRQGERQGDRAFFFFFHGSGKIFCLFLSFFENLGRKKKKIKIFRIFVIFFQDLSRSLRSLKNPEKKRKKKEKKRKKDEKDLENLFFLKKKIKKIFGILKNLFGGKKKKDFENLFFFFQRFLKISRFFMKFHGFFQDFSGFFQDFPRIFKSFLFFFFSQKSFFFFFFREKRIFFLEKKKKKKDLSRPVFFCAFLCDLALFFFSFLTINIRCVIWEKKKQNQFGEIPARKSKTGVARGLRRLAFTKIKKKNHKILFHSVVTCCDILRKTRTRHFAVPPGHPKVGPYRPFTHKTLVNTCRRAFIWRLGETKYTNFPFELAWGGVWLCLHHNTFSFIYSTPNKKLESKKRKKKKLGFSN